MFAKTLSGFKALSELGRSFKESQVLKTCHKNMSWMWSFLRFTKQIEMINVDYGNKVAVKKE